MPKKTKRAKIKSGTKKKVGEKGSKTRVKKTKLELSIEKYMKVPGKYKELMNAVDKWLCTYRDELIDLLKLQSNYTQACVTYDDFKAALICLEFPFTKLEIHLITMLLDRNMEGFIYFTELANSLNSLRLEKESESGALPSPLISGDRGWVLGCFYCITCLVKDNHPFHFKQLLPLNTYTEGIVEIIRRHTKLCTPTIQVYLDQSATESSVLKEQVMLTDRGLNGGPEWSPTEVQFYYRPGGFSPSDWSPTPLHDFLRVAYDPLLWSQMVFDEMRHEERVRRQLNALSLQDPEMSTALEIMMHKAETAPS
ncbi:hypothetical protein D915_004385 [Fasciola hepatica]|uniref:Uncharacterized protein n=1 Tax=Fasciola hepatica TaxID=6192 RepID=A0A2H1CF04_FASHE|nr:hypothetical protein D915_004385 [Fasciola hepatica]